MAVLGDSYRTYALDFWGFGESGTKRSSYAVKDFVDLVDEFMQQMGIARAPVVGHSMGGTVALLLAVRYPERVEKLVVIGSPIVGSSLHFFPRIFGNPVVGWITFQNLWLYRAFYHLLASAYSKHPKWVQMMDRDVSRTNLQAFFESIGSLRHTDLSHGLHQVSVPVLGMYGATDRVVDPVQWRALQEGAPHARIEHFPDSGHFIMLDEPSVFVRKLKDFLDGSQLP